MERNEHWLKKFDRVDESFFSSHENEFDEGEKLWTRLKVPWFYARTGFIFLDARSVKQRITLLFTILWERILMIKKFDPAAASWIKSTSGVERYYSPPHVTNID